MGHYFYLITRTDDVGYDEYDSFVVSAESEKDALSLVYEEKGESFSSGIFTKENTKIEQLQAVESKIILGSFNAG